MTVYFILNQYCTVGADLISETEETVTVKEIQSYKPVTIQKTMLITEQQHSKYYSEMIRNGSRGQRTVYETLNIIDDSTTDLVEVSNYYCDCVQSGGVNNTTNKCITCGKEYKD